MLRPPHSPVQWGRQNSIPSTNPPGTFVPVSPTQVPRGGLGRTSNQVSNPGYKEES
jgi:hypothetical protein